MGISGRDILLKRSPRKYHVTGREMERRQQAHCLDKVRRTKSDGVGAPGENFLDGCHMRIRPERIDHQHAIRPQPPPHCVAQEPVTQKLWRRRQHRRSWGTLLHRIHVTHCIRDDSQHTTLHRTDTMSVLQAVRVAQICWVQICQRRHEKAVAQHAVPYPLSEYATGTHAILI